MEVAVGGVGEGGVWGGLLPCQRRDARTLLHDTSPCFFSLIPPATFINGHSLRLGAPDRAAAPHRHKNKPAVETRWDHLLQPNAFPLSLIRGRTEKQTVRGRHPGRFATGVFSRAKVALHVNAEKYKK